MTVRLSVGAFRPEPRISVSFNESEGEVQTPRLRIAGPAQQLVEPAALIMKPRHRIPIALSLALLSTSLCPLAFAGNADSAPIVRATQTYLRRNSAVANAEVKVEKVDGDFARVMVIPPAGTADPAEAFLKRKNGAWSVLILGTGITPDDFKRLGIPKRLWPE